MAQTPIIFQPGPGLNNGTDEGGANGGKDVFIGDADNITHGTESAFVTSPVSNCNNTTWISLLKFDVSSLPSVVDSVVMVLHHTNPSAYCYSNCIADFYFGIVTQPWDETTVSYSNPPTISSTPFYSLLNHNWDDSLKVKEYNITQVYRDWRDGTVPNHGFEIYSTTVGCNNACVYVCGYSSDDTTNGGAYRPYLKVYTATSGIHTPNAELLGVQCYPNPANDMFTLEFTISEMQKIIVELTDVTGRVVSTSEYAMTAGTNKIPIAIKAVDAGLYYYHLKTNSGEVSGKLIKQ